MAKLEQPNNPHVAFFMNTMNALEGLKKKRQRTITMEFLSLAMTIKSEVSNFFERYADADGKLPREEMEKFNRLSKFELFLNEQIGLLTKSQNVVTRQAIIEAYTESFYRFGYMIESSLLASLSYGVLNPKKLDAILYNPLDLIKWSDRNKGNNEMMKRQLKEVLMQGMVQGLGYDKIAKALTEKVNIGASRAIKVVQTETHRATSAGNLESMKHAESKGVVMKKRWLSTLDKKTRDTHGKLDGQEVGVDEQFSSKGRKADAPSHFGVASEDINCRCTMISVVEGFAPTVRRARNSEGKNEVVPYTNYQEWQKGKK